MSIATLPTEIEADVVLAPSNEGVQDDMEHFQTPDALLRERMLHEIDNDPTKLEEVLGRFRQYREWCAGLVAEVLKKHVATNPSNAMLQSARILTTHAPEFIGDSTVRRALGMAGVTEEEGDQLLRMLQLNPEKIRQDAIAGSPLDEASMMSMPEPYPAPGHCDVCGHHETIQGTARLKINGAELRARIGNCLGEDIWYREDDAASQQKLEALFRQGEWQE